MSWLTIWQRAILRRDRVVPPEQAEQSEKFIDDEGEEGHGVQRAPAVSTFWWKVTTSILILVILVQTAVNPPFLREASYEGGWDSDLVVAKSAIVIAQTPFYGGILAHPNGSFYVNLDEKGPRYVGRPTQELDDAWDRIVGFYIGLTPEESRSIKGPISISKGEGLVTPAVQHNLHCLNFLRKSIYSDFYPTIHESRPEIPPFHVHVDHCVETIRQALQCHADLTPVAKVWSPEAGIFLPNTALSRSCRSYESIIQWSHGRNGMPGH